MSYLDDLATRIYDQALAAGLLTGDLTAFKLDSLFRLYAVLALAKGEEVTPEDVHNAWAAWTQDDDENHSALRPFTELEAAKQALDLPYAEAIRSAVREPGVVTKQ
jgi:ferric-dicitrate binding protein FerR (iron transport regulator)